MGAVPYLKKKNVNVDGAIKELNSKGELVQASVDEIKPLLHIPAQSVVLNVLKEMNITVHENKKSLINVTIKNAVNDLGHKSPTEAEKAV